MNDPGMFRVSRESMDTLTGEVGSQASMDDPGRGGGGYGKPTAHAHVMMFDPLPVGRMPYQVKRQWSR